MILKLCVFLSLLVLGLSQSYTDIGYYDHCVIFTQNNVDFFSLRWNVKEVINPTLSTVEDIVELRVYHNYPQGANSGFCFFGLRVPIFGENSASSISNLRPLEFSLAYREDFTAKTSAYRWTHNYAELFSADWDRNESYFSTSSGRQYCIIHLKMKFQDFAAMKVVASGNKSTRTVPFATNNDFWDLADRKYLLFFDWMDPKYQNKCAYETGLTSQ